MNLAGPYRRKLAEIIAKIEAQAFYDGHYLAVGFGGGSCKSIFEYEPRLGKVRPTRERTKTLMIKCKYSREKAYMATIRFC